MVRARGKAHPPPAAGEFPKSRENSRLRAAAALARALLPFRLLDNATLAMAQGRVRQASDAAAAILRYLEAHPAASDNLAGVTRWWLGLDPSIATLAVVEAALGELVEQGEVQRLALPDGGAVYRKSGPR